MSRIPKSFFDENPVDPLSAFGLQYLVLTKELDPGKDIEKRLDNLSDDQENNLRLANEADTPDKIVNAIRKIKGIIGIDIIRSKAISMEKETAPLIIDKYLRSSYTCYIENAINVLEGMDEKYTYELFNQYEMIRSPYAKAMACVLFAMKMGREINDFLLEEYDSLFMENPEDDEIDYSEGPLLALYIVNDMY